MIFVLGLLLLAVRVWHHLEQGGPKDVLWIPAVAVLSTVAAIFLLLRLSPRRLDGSDVSLLMWTVLIGGELQGTATGGRFSDAIHTWFFGVGGLLLVAYGLWAHRRHRRLGQRLARLGDSTVAGVGGRP